MAIARVRCVSGEIAPSDMACVLNRPRIEASVSTSSSGSGLPGTISRQVADRHRLPLLAEFHEGTMIFFGRRFDVAMHSPHQFRRTGVLLALMAEAIEPVVLQVPRSSSSRESDGKHRVVTIETILQELGQAFACERAAGIFEKLGCRHRDRDR